MMLGGRGCCYIVAAVWFCMIGYLAYPVALQRIREGRVKLTCKSMYSVLHFAIGFCWSLEAFREVILCAALRSCCVAKFKAKPWHAFTHVFQ